MYIYVCMYVCMYVYIYIIIYVFIYVYTYIYVCVYMYVCIDIYIWNLPAESNITRPATTTRNYTHDARHYNLTLNT